MNKTDPWHSWFARKPVKTEQHGWRWMRTVERAKRHLTTVAPFAPSYRWLYRPIAYDRHEAGNEH